MLRSLLIISLFILLSLTTSGQETDGFRFINPNQRSLKIKFKLVNNLIIIPVQLNGVELSFLLDTGVDKTLLIALEAGDSLDLKQTHKINIRGLGTDDSFGAYQSNGNYLEIGEAVNPNQSVYYIIDQNNHLTSGLGLPVNGIIGYDLFENFIVRIDYKGKNIKLYQPDRFKRKLKHYEMLPLQFYRNKPYLSITALDETITKSSLNLLLDTGNGSSFWFIEKELIAIPELYFEDILGYGFSSVIKGKRSKVNQVNFGKYKFKSPNVAYPEIDQILQVENNLLRDGTVGSEILRRFKLFVDYPNKQIFFRANSSLKEPFNYDKSGLILDYDGVKVVEEVKRIKMNSNLHTSEFNTQSTSRSLIISVVVKPKISVKSIRDLSPAQEVEILPGDELLKINGKNAYSLDLEEIRDILAGKKGSRIKLVFLRNEEEIKKEFYLRDRFEDLMNNSKN